MSEFVKKIKDVFIGFNAVDVLIILLFALMFYYVFRILKNSNTFLTDRRSFWFS